MKIFIGYDAQFKENLKVQLASLKNNSSHELDIHLLKLTELNNILYRKRDKLQSTDSAFTRWLVPYLSDYQGWSLYMDSDMLCRTDISTLMSLKDESCAVMLVKHENKFYNNVKFNGRYQTSYQRKNWSSFMLFNNERCQLLDLNYINSADGLELHQFKWLDDDDIGSLDQNWNHLVDVDPPNPGAKIVHWTMGGPWFDETKDVEFSTEWKLLADSLNQ